MSKSPRKKSSRPTSSKPVAHADVGKVIAEETRRLNPHHAPSITGVAWYARVNYPRCLAIFEDAADLPGTFDEWLAKAEQAEQALGREGMRVVRAEIDPHTFGAWCQAHGFQHIDDEARMEYANLHGATILARELESGKGKGQVSGGEKPPENQ